MLITRIEVDNLLSFGSLRLDLEPGLNVVVGPNDVGKSNLVRLVKLVRDALATHPSGGSPLGLGVEDRHVRLGSDSGRLSLGISLTEERERALMVTLIRAVAARAAEPPQGGQQPRTPEEWEALRARIADFVESCYTPDTVLPLLDFRLVAVLDRRQPARVALAYEFDLDGETFHAGLLGLVAGVGAVARGPFVMGHPHRAWTQPDLSGRMTPSASTWTPVTVRDLLPAPGVTSQWALSPTSTGEPLPLTTQLARLLGLAADTSRVPDLAWVLRDIVGRGVSVTANLRRPPNPAYSLADAAAGLTTEDAGDLPLELYRRKTGSADGRQAFADLQARFQAMTGHALDLRAWHQQVSGRQGESDAYTLVVEPQVETRAGWVPLDYAGAGLWEALVAVAATLSQPGQVVLLDEPATHLHSTWQRRLLRYLGDHHQVLVITHSPYLIPGDQIDDLQKVVRLAAGPQGPQACGLGHAAAPAPEGWLARWRQLLAGSTDFRDVLFARGAVLVEGETDLGAFRHWFNHTGIVGPSAGLDARNLALIAVDGDWNFGAYLSYLGSFAVPWVIVADGPALSPDYKHSLLSLSAPEETTGRLVMRLVGDQPVGSTDFAEWERYWARNGVLTVATSFGLKANGEKRESDNDGSGEIERYFRTLDPDLWDAVKQEFTSKVRRGYAFAERLRLDDRPEAVASLQELWRSIRERLGAEPPR